MNAFIAQCKWEMLRQVRNRRFLFFSVLLPVAFYFLFVRITGNPNMSIDGASWKAYYMMSMATFGVVGGAINGLSSRIAFERTQGWMRLVQTTPLPNWSYFGSKVIAQLVLNVIMILIVFLAGGFGEHVQMTAAQWITCGVGLVVGAVPFIALGILIGFAAGAEASQIIASGVYFIVSILGGLWFPTTAMPSVMKDISKWTPTNRMADIAWNTLGGHTVPVSDFLVLAGYLVFFSALAMRLLRRQEEQAA